MNESKQELPITHIPMRHLLPLTAVFIAALLGIAWILINFTDSKSPSSTSPPAACMAQD